MSLLKTVNSRNSTQQGMSEQDILGMISNKMIIVTIFDHKILSKIFHQ